MSCFHHRIPLVLFMVLCVGNALTAQAEASCSDWEPYIELIGNASETAPGSHSFRGIPSSIACDRALEMSGEVTCRSPWFGIDPDANLTWRATGVVLIEEFVFANTVVRWLHGGSFTIRDEDFPLSSVLEGHFQGLVIVTWNMVTHSGAFSASIEMTGGSARIPGPEWFLSLGSDWEFDGDPTGWETLVHGAICPPAPTDPRRSIEQTSWGKIKGLYR